MLLGTAWLTASNFISRFLGAIYIIPWYIWMGKHGAEANGLFTMGYNIYAWFLLISTAGVPVAVAKQVAKYNTIDQKDHSFSHFCSDYVSLITVLCACIRSWERADSSYAESVVGCASISGHECYSWIFPRF